MTTHIETFAKYAGLVTICFEWLMILLVYLQRPEEFNGSNPISYFASFPETRVIFAVCLTIAATSFWIFTRFHLTKYYVAPVRIFTMSMLAYAALAITPFSPNDPTSEAVHKVLALLFTLFFLAGVFFMGKNNTQGRVRPMSYWAVALSIVTLVVFFSLPKGSESVFIAEAAGVFILQVWTIWISFHSFKTPVRLQS